MYRAAIKIIDIDELTTPLHELQRQTQTSLTSHPNVIQSHVSFVAGHHLWIVKQFASGGSCENILGHIKSGLQEHVIANMLRDVVSGLCDLHAQEQMHRDIKAANIFVHSDGRAALGGLDSMRDLIESGNRQRARTYVGTLQWMAPEVLEQSGEYDVKADIWSVGMTALELAYGKVPLDGCPPMKVMTERLHKQPPELCGDYSRDFQDLVKACLQYEPGARPTAAELAELAFLKSAEETSDLREVLDRIPSLADRYKALQRGNRAKMGSQPPGNKPPGGSPAGQLKTSFSFDSVLNPGAAAGAGSGGRASGAGGGMLVVQSAPPDLIGDDSGKLGRERTRTVPTLDIPPPAAAAAAVGAASVLTQQLGQVSFEQQPRSPAARIPTKDEIFSAGGPSTPGSPPRSP
eukprot:SAG22_NODE_4163_length_1362_cov_1.749010_1_plen_404_part_01